MLDFGPRYYNAVLGRFFSPDPILASASAYSYGEGNPIMLYDPSGMESVPLPPPLFDVSSIHSPNATMGDLDDSDPFSPNYSGDGSSGIAYNNDLNREQADQNRRERRETACFLAGIPEVAETLNKIEDQASAGGDFDFAYWANKVSELLPDLATRRFPV